MATSSVIRPTVGDTTTADPPAARPHPAHLRPARRGSRRPSTLTPPTTCASRSRARRRANLYSAIEPLPAYRRRALCAIYAFARRVRDTADGNLHRAEKLWLLAEARAGIPHDGTPRPVDPVLVALRDVNRRFPIPLASLDDLIDGAESDVHGVTYETFEDLVQYCRQIAGSIGRLSVAVLGSRDPAAAAQLADDLGVAMQLTKILRDSGRGLPARTRVSAARGLRAVRLSGRSAVGRSGAAGQADPLPGSPKPRVVRPRAPAAAAARCPGRRVHRRQWPGSITAFSSASSARRTRSCKDGSRCQRPRRHGSW